jgi:glycosyltransferase involved in cell wall biosynthesis
LKIMKVSIIITCYNYGAYLDESLQSALNQTYKNCEVIIVDDASTDSFTKERLDCLEKEGIRIIRHSSNQGVAAARNTGIAAATGEVILPLDADDRIHLEYTEKAIEVFEKTEGPAVVYCKAELFGSVNQSWDLPEYYDGILVIHNVIFATVFFYKSEWDACGGYKTELPFWEDYEFLLSLAESGNRFIRIPDVLFFYRRGHNSRDTLTVEIHDSVKNAMIIKYHPEYLIKNIDKLYHEIIELEGSVIHYRNSIPPLVAEIEHCRNDNLILSEALQKVINSLPMKIWRAVVYPLKKIRNIWQRKK